MTLRFFGCIPCGESYNNGFLTPCGDAGFQWASPRDDFGASSDLLFDL